MGSLLIGDNKKANANQNINWLKKCVFMGLGEWDFCLKPLSTPTKTLPLLFGTHTLTLNVEQKNNEHSIHLPHFNAIIQKYTHENLLILYYLGLSIAFLWTAFSLF